MPVRGWTIIVVVGHAKTYDHLISLKVEFEKELDWIIYVICDFHIFCDYQHILMSRPVAIMRQTRQLPRQSYIFYFSSPKILRNLEFS